MSTATPAPKAMSSRLLTMKFMQRAAASPIASSPKTPDEPSPKRRKTESSTPTKFNVDSLADQRAVQAAMASEEAKRQLALEKQAAEAGDTRWVLSFDDQKHAASAPFLALRFVETGFANLDTSPSNIRYVEDDEEDKPVMVGRRSFGKFNKAIEKQEDGSAEDTSESGSADEVGDSEDDIGAAIRELAGGSEATERVKAERKAKKKAEKAAFSKLAKERKKKEVSLNANREVDLTGMTSLSGKPDTSVKCFECGGPHRKSDCPSAKAVECFNCGSPHRKQNCPNGKRRYDGGDDDRPRKTQKAR